MASDPGQSLLAADDPPPVRIVNPGGASPFLLLGDHAGNLIPARLGSMGVAEQDMARHIAWDIGIAGLGVMLADVLDAAFIRQSYSRLVIDCNRDPAAADAMPAVSDGTAVPANAALTPADRAARVAAIHAPYQAAIAAELARRDDRGGETLLVSLHSFTPSMRGHDRPWQIGLLHDRGDASLSRALLSALRARGDLVVGDNEPYAMDGIDHTIPRHAYPARRRYVEIEIRQDLLATEPMQRRWCDLLATLLPEAAAAPA